MNTYTDTAEFLVPLDDDDEGDVEGADDDDVDEINNTHQDARR